LEHDLTPLIIIGAPRSGTNMLRDVLTRLPGFNTWPCDEINYIWRRGNARHPSDALPAHLARPAVGDYIRRQFKWVQRRDGGHTVVEKTCANSLRVPFVDAVVPEARYLFIQRDGIDAVASAIPRWHARPEIPYLARKARFVPWCDAPVYAARVLQSRARRLFETNPPPKLWGPQIEGMADWFESYTLAEVCAWQWRCCLERSLAALQRMPEERWLTVRYESFVREPAAELRRISQWLNVNCRSSTIESAVADVTSDNIGKGADRLDSATYQRLQSIVRREPNDGPASGNPTAIRGRG